MNRGINHDFQCANADCGLQFDAVVEYTRLPAGPPCPLCQSPTARIWLPKRVSWNADPVVVYRAPDGSYRYPGESSGSTTAKYDRMGYERIECRGFAEVRSLEKRLNDAEHSRSQRQHELTQARREHAEAIRNSELRRVMQQHMTEDGRKFARRVMELRDQVADARRRRNLDRGREEHRSGLAPGIFIEVYSMDRSNRERDGRSRRE